MFESDTFPQMWRVLPQASLGDAEVRHVDVTEQQSRFTAIRGAREYVPAGRYAQLLVRKSLYMSDTHYERRTNAEVVRQARGDVLIAGYGLGMILPPILAKTGVRSVTVVEREPDVVGLVDPLIRAHVGASAAAKLSVLVADIAAAKPRLAPREGRAGRPGPQREEGGLAVRAISVGPVGLEEALRLLEAHWTRPASAPAEPGLFHGGRIRSAKVVREREHFDGSTFGSPVRHMIAGRERTTVVLGVEFPDRIVWPSSGLAYEVDCVVQNFRLRGLLRIQRASVTHWGANGGPIVGVFETEAVEPFSVSQIASVVRTVPDSDTGPRAIALGGVPEPDKERE